MRAAEPDPRGARLRAALEQGAGRVVTATPAELDHRVGELVRLGVEVWRRGEKDYPRCLLDLADPPAALFVRGRLADPGRAVAIVGSRAASEAGRRHAFGLAADLARLGLVVVSGLARGIDAAAHRGALESGGCTVAVLPGGLDEVTPRHHRALAEAIAMHGAWVSEHAHGAPAFRSSFVARNRLIAALSIATVVVEAATRSGALSTAAAARRIGRTVLAMPGDIDRPTTRGCHALLRDGARVCTGAADVLAAIQTGAGGSRRARLPRTFSKQAQAAAATSERPGSAPPETGLAALMGALAPRPQGVEALAAAAGVTVTQALALLIRLEWSGVAAAHPGQRWSRRAERGR